MKKHIPPTLIVFGLLTYPAFADGEWNRVAIDLRPLDKGVSLQAVSVAPDASFAVETAAVGQ